MANWELLQYRMDGHKVIRRAQCPYCDFIVEYSNNGDDYPPVKCPDCARELEYERPCSHFVGSLAEIPLCTHRGSCYGCAVFREAHWTDRD